MNPRITRREFGLASAIAAAGAAGIASTAAALPRARYAHVDLAAGPWSRSELARIAKRVTRDCGWGEPVKMTALGADADGAVFPEEFAITLDYADGARMVVRASRAHAGEARVTVRSV